MGPAKLVSILGDGDLLKRITECLNAPLDEISKVKELSEFSKRIGVETIVRTNINIYPPFISPILASDTSGTKLVGSVEVNAELIDLNLIPPQIINRSAGNAEYSSTKGWFAGAGGYPGGFIILPFAYGKTFGRAVDQATRDALSQLFKKDSKPNERFIKHVSGLVRDENTDLEWIAGPDKDTTWFEAIYWVENLSIDGGGWRLPTINELQTLNEDSAGKCSITTSLKTSGWWVWSSSLDIYRAWQFSFYSGADLSESVWVKDDARGFAVRFRKKVSSEEAKRDYTNVIETDLGSRFVAYSNGKVLDRKTGIEWIAGPDKDTTWYEAYSWVENLTTDGGGWRMPTLEELKILSQNLAGAKDMATVLNTSGLFVWSGENHGAEKTFSKKISLFNCSISSTCYDSSKKTRCFAVRSK